MEALRNLGFLLGCYSWQRTVALEAEIAELAPSQYIAFFIRKKKKTGKNKMEFWITLSDFTWHVQATFPE